MSKKLPNNLNLGSGPNGIEGWHNYDWGILPILSRLPSLRKLLIKIGLLDKTYDILWPKIVIRDIRKPFGFMDGEVDNIYCSHVLEHFEKYEAKKILLECRRVLKKNGIVRIVLPDLVKIIRQYDGADNFCRVFFGFDKDIVRGVSSVFIRGHQWMYDVASIESLLDEVGFTNVCELKFREGKCPDIERLDFQGHEKISMYIEASKT